MPDKFGKVAILVLVCGVLLRATLALINWEANDAGHIAVIRVIADENRIPDKNEDGEAFQPKLYHVTVAALWKIVPTHSLPIRIRIAQLVSCTAGILTLLFALNFFMSKSGVSAKVRCLAFSMLALNPILIGINAQATNDSFVILFVSLSLYFGYRFFENAQVKDYCWMTVSTVLAGVSKGNGLIIFIAVLTVFSAGLLQKRNACAMAKGQMVLYGSIFLVAFLAVVPRVGPYWEHYRRYGSPFVTNATPYRFPFMFKKTPPFRPGVTSIADALLTFRLLDMLRTPVITNDPRIYPQHRTSLWSQLYGRTHFARFDAWPPSWQLPPDCRHWATRLVWNLGRLSFLCALLPTILLVVAIWRGILFVVRCLIRIRDSPFRLSNWLINFSIFGYLAFIIIYSLRYREFEFMKSIFIFPGLFSFLLLFAHECDRLYTWVNQSNAIRQSVDVVFLLLCLLYTADVIVLIGQLGIQTFTGALPPFWMST
jgi:Dolichyl-phosphate-mannose-protein mannosyltransferase